MYAKRTLFTLIVLLGVFFALASTTAAPPAYPVVFVPTHLYTLPPPEPAPLRTRREAIELVLLHEGGYSAHDADPGGPTNFGITQRTARLYGFHKSMRSMTRADAISIYGAIWDDYGLGAIPDPEVAIQGFDAVVAHGPRGLKWIRDGPGACRYINQRRMAAYQNSKGWQSFRRGWTKRINTNLARCPG